MTTKYQPWYAIGFVVCVLLMLAALYFQYILGLAPCPLCMFQRVFVVAIGVLCLIGIVHKPGLRAHRIYACLIALFALCGAGIAGRQVWLQSLPADQVPECGPDLEFMLQAFPLTEIITTVLSGSGECAEIQWSFLGLSMPTWMLVIFIVMALVALSMFFRSSRRYFS